MTAQLVRWRADPRRVRVSIRKLKEDQWVVKVEMRASGREVLAIAENPEVAILDAIDEAERHGLGPGIDSRLLLAYSHPWKDAV